MNDYTQKIIDLPKESQDTIIKVIERYENSYDTKQRFKLCFDRQVTYLADGKKVPFTLDEVNKAFKAKNFFKDLTDCGSFLNFRYYKTHKKTKLHTANFCKRDKLCLACAVRRAYKQQLKFMSIIEENKELLDKDWYYIVIPIKHTKRESYETVMGRVVELRKKITQAMRNSRKGKSNNFWSNFDGGMYSQEVTKNDNGWNVHLNVIVNAPKGTKINLKSIKNRRGQISYQNESLRSFMMKNYDSQMHNITKIKDNSKLRDEIVEVLKYSLKFSSLTQQELFYVFVKSVGVRLFGTFGNLWGKGLDNVMLEGSEFIDEEFEELIFIRAFPEQGGEYKLYSRKMKRDEKKVEKERIPMEWRRAINFYKTPMIITNIGKDKFHLRVKDKGG